MKRKAAPALAGWMVEHLVPGGLSDGLADDLLEEMAAGRTSRWYWRQAVAAVAAWRPLSDCDRSNAKTLRDPRRGDLSVTVTRNR